MLGIFFYLRIFFKIRNVFLGEIQRGSKRLFWDKWNIFELHSCILMAESLHISNSKGLRGTNNLHVVPLVNYIQSNTYF